MQRCNKAPELHISQEKRHASQRETGYFDLTYYFNFFSMATLAYAIRHGYHPGELWVEYAYTVDIATGLLVLIKFASHALGPMGHENSLSHLIMFSTKNLTRHQITGIILWLAAISMTMGSFTTFKSLIPYGNPFRYDEDFMKMDLYISRGKAPWQVTHEAFSHPISTRLIMQYYHLSFVTFWLSLAATLISERLADKKHRMCLATILCFIIIGSLTATYLSSAGPCYYHWLNGDSDPYKTLISRLKDQDLQLRKISDTLMLYSLEAQDYLKESAEKGILVYGGGISAAPSMHLSTATLTMLLGWHLNKTIGLILSLGAILTWIGSIHLGWHYAIDGVLAFFMTLGIWMLSGKIMGRHDQ